MITTGTNMMTLSMTEYLLRIEPRQELSDQIMQIRKSFSGKYHVPQAIKTKPYISLAHFFQYNSFEMRIRERLRVLGLSQSPVCIELLDFGSLPAHTIFINIISRWAVQSLVKHLRAGMQPLLKTDGDHRPHFIMEPRLLIASKLKPWQYDESWPVFKYKNFSGHFIADKMVLLKRVDESSSYEVVEKFEFQNLPVFAKQVALF